MVAGLLRWPSEIVPHSEQLARANLADPRFDALIDAAESGAPLESGALSTILAEQRLAAPAPAEYGNIKYSFLRDDVEAAEAAEALGTAIGVLVEGPALERAIAAAMARFEHDGEAALAEVDRLRKRKLELNTRLRQMASARAAEPSGEAPKPMAD